MGCLVSVFKLIFAMIEATIMIFGYILAFLFIIIKFIVNKIIQANKNKKTDYYQNNSTRKQNTKSKIILEQEKNSVSKIDLKQKINSTKNVTNSDSYLKIYINKKYKGLCKNDELNYELLNIKSYDAPTVYYDDLAEIKDYNVFEAFECSSEKYGDLLQRIHNHCGNDFYATIGYEYETIEYRITVKDNIIYINEMNAQHLKNKYTFLKNKITSFSDKLFDYLMYIDDDNYYDDVVPNDDLDCDSITSLSDKLKETNEILLFEIPYMEEISMIIDIIEPKIIKEYNKGQQKALNGWSIIESKEYAEEPIIKQSETKRKSWKEQQFDEEAELWGLSEEDKRIAKEERMSPAEFVEAEEYDDDELLLDEWER